MVTEKNFNGHRIIEIDEAYSYNNLASFCRVLEPQWELREILINFNVSEGIPFSHVPSVYWPFRAIFTDGEYEVHVHIRNLSVGIPSWPTDDLCNILEFLGISYKKEDLYTNKLQQKDGYIRLLYHNK